MMDEQLSTRNNAQLECKQSHRQMARVPLMTLQQGCSPLSFLLRELPHPLNDILDAIFETHRPMKIVTGWETNVGGGRVEDDIVSCPQ